MLRFRNRDQMREAVTGPATRAGKTMLVYTTPVTRFGRAFWGYTGPMMLRTGRTLGPMINRALVRYGLRQQLPLPRRRRRMLGGRVPQILGLTGAAAAGAGIALLLAPRPGAETRRMVLERSRMLFSGSRGIVSRSREPVMRTTKVVWQRSRSTGTRLIKGAAQTASQVTRRSSQNGTRAVTEPGQEE